MMEPGDPAARVSHETIYAAIHAQPRGGLKAAMVEALRQAKPARGRRRTTLAGSAIVLGIAAYFPPPRRDRGAPHPRSLGMKRDHSRRCGRVSPTNDLINGAFIRSSVGNAGRAQDPLRCSVQFKREAIDPEDRL